jgi:hypothetical protein
MNTKIKLPENKRKQVYDFTAVACMNESVETSMGTDPTTPSPLTTTHLLTGQSL